jgi:hypothetical protein
MNKDQFKWESDEEYAYRKSINNVSSKVSNVLGGMKKYAKTLEYLQPLQELKKEYNELVKMSVPESFRQIHDYLVEGMTYYLKGFELLRKTFENPDNTENPDINKIVKAQKNVECGNSFIKIATMKNFELIEERELCQKLGNEDEILSKMENKK